MVVVRIIAYRAGGFQLAIAPVYHIAATQENDEPLLLAVTHSNKEKRAMPSCAAFSSGKPNVATKRSIALVTYSKRVLQQERGRSRQ